MLYQLLYVSDFDASVPSDMDAIVQRAKEVNERLHVTGALWFDGRTFLQMLEGGRAALSEVLTRIMRSNVHRNVELVCFRPAAERLFSDWSMAYFHAGDEDGGVVKKFSVDNEFRPRDMSAESLISFMRYLEMQRQVSAVHSI